MGDGVGEWHSLEKGEGVGEGSGVYGEGQE